MTVTAVVPVPPDPELVEEPTVSVIVPLEAANVELPEYVATIVCDPDVVEENV